jgi:hypothetical protein
MGKNDKAGSGSTEPFFVTKLGFSPNTRCRPSRAFADGDTLTKANASSRKGQNLRSESKVVVQLEMGMVGTMSALVLGPLVASPTVIGSKDFSKFDSG